mmetsp:Transcript_13578/g.31943  ORF Transcript_13578/g.31943 Transcript_13578/m.31943 type:complete len:151 (+) Transcript_13578:87-539(+)
MLRPPVAASPSTGSLASGVRGGRTLASSPSGASLRGIGTLAASPSGASLRIMGQSASKASLCSVASDGGPSAVAPPKTLAGPVHQVGAGMPARESTGTSSAWIIEQVIDFGLPEEHADESTEESSNKDCEGLCVNYTSHFFSVCTASTVK